jgi:lipopolysaccharide transport system permease protein
MQKTVITSKPDSFVVFFRKIWLYRGLIWAFAVRDIKVKYSQTLLGLSWSLIQPLTALLIFSVVLGYMFNWKVGELPYTLHLLSGIMGWNFFSYIVHSGSSSIQESAHIIKKVYFPKSVLPLSKVLVAATELLVSFLVLIPLMIYFREPPTIRILLMPLILIFNSLCGLALVFWVSAFAYKKRDLFHLLPFVVYFGVWLTPVFFTLDFFPEKIQSIVLLNPMTSVIQLWRWMLFANSDFHLTWLISFLIVAVFCITGMYFYNRKEFEFGDYA